MIYVIMLEPVTSGNVGAVARVMRNFGFTKLVLINPHCDHRGAEARNRAKHAQKILEEAEVTDFFVVDDYDYLIATTAKLGTDYNIPRSPLKPDEFARKIRGIDPSKKIGLVIGRETHGLFNEEIAKCDFIVTIPSDPQYPTLNISHSVAILLYELHKEISDTDITKHITPIGKPEKDQILRMFDQIFDSMQWETPEKKETQKVLWKKTIGKAMLTRREAYGVMGFLRKVIRMKTSVKSKKTTKAKKSQKGSIKNMPLAKTIHQSFSAPGAKKGAAEAKKSTPKPRKKPSTGKAKR
ncbi:TrmJ/YjtD family RNA methyltransferase [Candidatus Woesearchaeota archaeon]|nr:TrmJ/YjtD family RNA methyltransferase [Candidatus Woesearchaeota archaeon]